MKNINKAIAAMFLLGWMAAQAQDTTSGMLEVQPAPPQVTIQLPGGRAADIPEGSIVPS